MDRLDYSTKQELEAHRVATFRRKNKSKCPECGFYGCFCQISLKQYVEE